MNNQKITLPKVYVNAEFQRLLWVNSGSLGLSAGVVLLYIFFLMGKDVHIEWSTYLFIMGTMGIGLSSVVAYVLLSRSLAQDVSSNMFDQLRMSSLSAWQMAYSRLLVAPMVAWVGFGGGFLCLLCGSLFLDTTNTKFYDEIEIFIWCLPFMAWAFACVILSNALQFGRRQTQWSGSFIQLILFYIVLNVFVSDMVEHLSYTYDFVGLSIVHDNMLIFLTSSILLSIWSSAAAYATMTWRLHLKSGRGMFLVLALLSPILFWWFWVDVRAFLTVVILCYTVMTLLSIVVQEHRILIDKPHKFRLPAWWILLPLGLVLSLFLNTALVWVYLQMAFLAFLVWGLGHIKLGAVHSVTLAMMIYLVLYSLGLLLL